MRLLHLAARCVGLVVAVGAAPLIADGASATSGVEALVRRRLPHIEAGFEFAIINATASESKKHDSYVVSSTDDAKVRVEGTTTSALLTGLHRYLSDVAHVDIWWYFGSQLSNAPASLPPLSTPLQGASTVPFRYHFNTVTTSYTSAFWSWEDWELQLDWMALRGINLPLAWVGVEKIFIQVFQEIGLTDAEIETFISGPAFLAWNHFGNIQGSWGGSMPYSWVDSQFELQLKIIKRMVELGMTPILPAFPGYVPRAITRVWPEANVTNGSTWEDFPVEWTNVTTFLDPFDPGFKKLQTMFIQKQREAYGPVTSFYTLDQFNENHPASGDLEYLSSVSQNTWQSLKAADPDAVWVMQGWLFYSSRDFWTEERIAAFLGGVTHDEDMLILDLFSESQPQWQRTKSYGGKPWIWCQLHNYGGNMGLYGQVENITINAVEALEKSPSMVGFGLSMEGQEGNEIVYDLLLAQAWSEKPIGTELYFHDWVTARYGADTSTTNNHTYLAWELVRTTIFNNTNLTANAVPKSPMELVPNIKGLLDRVGHHPTVLNYDPVVMREAWTHLYSAAVVSPALYSNPAYAYDLVDWTRQVLANAFIPLYEGLVAAYHNTTAPPHCRTSALRRREKQMTSLLTHLDHILATNDAFRLDTWTEAARKSAGSDQGAADYLEYNARNQVTLWGPKGEISDYASRSWAGLVGGYYLPRWQMFVEYLVATEPTDYNQTEFAGRLLEWEVDWVERGSREDKLKNKLIKQNRGVEGDLREVVEKLVAERGDLFGVGI